MEFKVIETRIVLRNILTKDADCRCGNIELNEIEKLAIESAIELISSMHEHCVNNGCHLQDK